MKKIICVALVSMFCLTAFARGKQPVSFPKMPEVLQTEILKNFTEDQVQLITSEKTMPRHHKFVFHLADGTKLEYMSIGKKKLKIQFRQITNPAGIKQEFVPENIQSYIQETFPNATITSYEKETMNQTIELNQDMVLIFNKSGKFIRID